MRHSMWYIIVYLDAHLLENADIWQLCPVERLQCNLYTIRVWPSSTPPSKPRLYVSAAYS